MKVALTGATGLLGRHLCALLTDRGVPFVAIDRQKWNLSEWNDTARFDAITEGADIFIHCAAKIPTGVESDASSSLRDLYDINVRAVLNLAQWAAGRNVHLIFISSGSVYRDPHSAVIREDAATGPGPIGGSYAASKRMAESVIAECAETDGLKATILRPSSLYGFGLPEEKFLIRMLQSARAGHGIEVSGPENRIDFVHAHDLSRAALMAAETGATGVFNIAGSGPVRLAELGQVIAAFGPAGPVDLLIELDREPPFTRFALDSSAAANAFGYRPSVSLPSGLEMTLEQKLMPTSA